MDRLVVGCGYLGRRVADRWAAEGRSVAALTRSSRTADAFRNAGLEPILGDLTARASLDALPEADVMLVAVGYDRSAGPSKREVYVDGLRNLLDATLGRVGRILYISSTSVYGVSDGGDVDDDTPAEPAGESGRICLDAEHLLFRKGVTASSPSVVLRLGGIYGPDRLLRRTNQLTNREPIAGSPEAWLNLIHVDDAATAVIAATEGAPRSTYVVTDDEPVRRVDYYGRLAELIGSPPPVFDDAASPRHAAGHGKRCVGAAVKRDLVSKFAFPTYREGLVDAVERSAPA